MFIHPVPRAGAGVLQLDTKLEGQALILSYGPPHLWNSDAIAVISLIKSDPPSDGQHANQTRSCGLSRVAQLVLTHYLMRTKLSRGEVVLNWCEDAP